VGELTAGDDPLTGYNDPTGVLDGRVLYRYSDTAELSRLHLVDLSGAGEPQEVDFPEGAEFLWDTGVTLRQDEASGKVIYAVDEGEGFALHELTADGSTAPLASLDAVPAQNVATVTYHLGGAGGAYWFALVEEQDRYLGSQDYLGLYRMDIESGQVEEVAADLDLGTNHHLHDLGEIGVAISGPADLLLVPPAGQAQELPSVLLEEYPGADRNLFDSVRGQGDEVLVAGYQTVELHGLSSGGSAVLSGTCGMQDDDFTSPCYFGHTFFGPGDQVASVYSDSVFTYHRP